MAFHGISTKTQRMYMQIPLGDPPLGVIPNHEHPSRPLREGMVASTVLGSVLTTALLLMRLYTRRCVVKKVWWDDYFLMLAWTLYMAILGVAWHIDWSGGGVHNWNLTFFDFVKILYWGMIVKALYTWTIMILKISILLQIMRIFVPARRGNELMFWTTTILIGATFVFYLIEFFLDILKCSPRERAWNPTIPGHCIFRTNLIYRASFNVISDVVILALPIAKIWRLQMPRERKIGVSLIFSIGAVAVVTSVMRLYYSWKIMHVEDLSYYSLLLTLWVIAEILAGIVVACMPSIPKFATEAKNLLSSSWSRLGSTSRKTATATATATESGSGSGSVSRVDPFQHLAAAAWKSGTPCPREHWEAGTYHLSDVKR